MNKVIKDALKELNEKVDNEFYWTPGQVYPVVDKIIQPMFNYLENKYKRYFLQYTSSPHLALERSIDGYSYYRDLQFLIGDKANELMNILNSYVYKRTTSNAFIGLQDSLRFDIDLHNDKPDEFEFVINSNLTCFLNTKNKYFNEFLIDVISGVYPLPDFNILNPREYTKNKRQKVYCVFSCKEPDSSGERSVLHVDEIIHNKFEIRWYYQFASKSFKISKLDEPNFIEDLIKRFLEDTCYVINLFVLNLLNTYKNKPEPIEVEFDTFDNDEIDESYKDAIELLNLEKEIKQLDKEIDKLWRSTSDFHIRSEAEKEFEEYSKINIRIRELEKKINLYKNIFKNSPEYLAEIPEFEKEIEELKIRAQELNELIKQRAAELKAEKDAQSKVLKDKRKEMSVKVSDIRNKLYNEFKEDFDYVVQKFNQYMANGFEYTLQYNLKKMRFVDYKLIIPLEYVQVFDMDPDSWHKEWDDGYYSEYDSSYEVDQAGENVSIYYAADEEGWSSLQLEKYRCYYIPEHNIFITEDCDDDVELDNGDELVTVTLSFDVIKELEPEDIQELELEL